MQKFWRKWAPYWHICTAVISAVIFAIVWVKDVSGAAREVTGIKADVQEIKFNLKAISSRLGIDYIETAEGQ